MNETIEDPNVRSEGNRKATEITCHSLSLSSIIITIPFTATTHMHINSGAKLFELIFFFSSNVLNATDEHENKNENLMSHHITFEMNREKIGTEKCIKRSHLTHSKRQCGTEKQNKSNVEQKKKEEIIEWNRILYINIELSQCDTFSLSSFHISFLCFFSPAL